MPQAPDVIDQYERGYREAQVLMTATRLNVFDAIEAGEVTSERLATALQVSTRGIRILCDALVGMGLLQKEGTEYRNGPEVRDQLLDTSPNPRKEMVLHGAKLYERWGSLYDSVVSGERVPKERGDPRLDTGAKGFARAMGNIGRRSAKPTVEALNLAGTKRMLDAGGGPGLYVIEFVLAYPELHAVLFDSAETLEVACRNIEEAGVRDRITLMAGDLFVDPVGENYDLIFLSNLAHCYSADRCRELIGKLAQALAPGGKLCIKDFILEPGRTGPTGALMFSVNMLVSSDDGDAYTAEEITEWFQAAGLEPQEQIPLTEQSSLIIAAR